MAKVTDVFVSGTIENLVFYRRMGKSCIRIKRNSIKQTASTKLRSLNFGIAARAAKGLRSGLLPVMPLPKDRSMQSRFSGAIAKWLGHNNVDEMPPDNAAMYLSGFQFTTGAPFNTRFKVAVAVSQQQPDHITIGIDAFVPALQIQAPAGTLAVLLTITVANCALKNGSPNGTATQTITIPFNDTAIPAQYLDFTIPAPPESLTVAAARLQYYVNGNSFLDITKDPTWIPAGVVNARYV